MPTVRADSHRGRVCAALSTDEWMNCRDVASATRYDPDAASSVLSDVHRAGYVERREKADTSPHEPTYEYRRRDGVRVG